MELVTIPSTHLFDFLNTTQSGAAHLATGVSVTTLTASLVFSLLYFLVQIAAFSVLRTKFKDVYQSFRLSEQCQDFFAWIRETANDSILEYRDIGIDAYYFLRFLVVMICVILVPIGTINISVLIPILIAGNKGDYVQGLDRLSISNVPRDHTERYIAHFVLAIINIALVQYVIYKELQYCTLHRHLHLAANVSYNTVLLVSNIPQEKLQRESLLRVFNKFYGGVRDVWLIPDCERLEKLTQLHSKLEQTLELMRMQDTAPTVEIYRANRALRSLEPQIKRLRVKLLSPQEPGCYGRAFIVFNNPFGAYMAKNTLVFGEPFEMNDFTIDIDPKGIIWSNVQRGPSWKLVFSTNMANILGVAITVGWVVPVSFVGLVIQLPYLTTLIPYARWLNALPKIVKEVIAGILPTIALTCLTEIAQAMFRKLSLMRGVLTMAELELDLQRWYFSFLFVQVFLVVTISSGIMVIVEVALYNPTSLATIVARDLPKASSFFYSFFLLRGFTICGNVLLRLTELLKFLFHRRFVDSSEVNQKMRMAANAPRFRLGMLYPTVSLFGTIALVYAILAPLILVGTTISLMLIFIGYKYCFKNVFYRENHSETYGKLYTVALLQLYSGIYCLEICLIGFFGIVKDDSGIPCFNLSMGMILVFVATIITHTSILRKFSVPMAVLPLSLDNGLERDQNRVSTATRLGYLPASFGMCADQSPKM